MPADWSGLASDWSAQPSGHDVDGISPVAIEIARRYLLEDNTPGTQELAKESTKDLIQRLNLVDGDGQLTNAGALLFVAYARRMASTTSGVRLRQAIAPPVSRVEGDR